MHLIKILDKPPKDSETIGNQKSLAGKHNDEKLAITVLIVGIRLTAYHYEELLAVLKAKIE